MRVTAGVYPTASSSEIAELFPLNNYVGDWLFCMDWAGIPVLRQYRPNLFIVGRTFQSDPQVDFGQQPENEANRWFSIISSSGMNPGLNGWVGPNEYFSSGSLGDTVWNGLKRGQWVARFESRLGYRVYYELNKRYWWGSISVGNVDPTQYVTYFLNTLNPTVTPWLEGPAYHAYCRDKTTTAESTTSPDFPYYVYRPWWWWSAAGARWKSCLISEAGTSYSWKNIVGETPDQYANTLKSIAQACQQMHDWGMPVSPPAVFAYGVYSPLGNDWNVDGTTFTDQIAAYNPGQPIYPLVAVPSVTVPGAPSLSAGATSGAIPLSWTVPSNGGSAITGYKVYRGTTSGGETLLASASSSTTTYNDSAVSLGTTYYYSVTAVNAIGEGPNSNEVSAKLATVPGAPSLSVSAPGNVVQLSWKVPSNGGSAITGYRVYRGTTSGGETLLTSVASSATTYNDSAVTVGTTYYYVVTAVNAIGEGPDSNEISATPQPGTPPSAPQNLRATTAKGRGVSLSWSLPANSGSSPITGYNVYRGTASGAETFLVSLGNVTSDKDTATVSRRTYYYKVKAVNAAGESVFSNEASAVAK